MPAQPSPTPPQRRTGVLERRATIWIIDDLTKGTIAHKYQVVDAICVAKDRLGLSNGAIAVLRALISFHPNVTLQTGEPLVIHPSNKLLQARANGMAEATLRRHLATLVSSGIIARRDSPNGKRYVRQGADEKQIYGFDLSLLVARAPEFETLKKAVEAEARERRRLLDLVTIYRRDLRETITEALLLHLPGDWEGIQATFASLSHERADRLGSDRLRALVDGLDQLGRHVDDTLRKTMSSTDSDGDGAQFERQLLESKPKPFLESEPGFRESQGQCAAVQPEARRSPPREFPLSMVLQACPDFALFARHGVSSWRDFVSVAETVRGAFGISPSAWAEAVDSMGAEEACVALAAIVQRSAMIKSPGGYLRNLTEKARAGKFSAWPMLMALWRLQQGYTKRE